MFSKISFITYCVMGTVGGAIVAALALLFMGAGHSPYIEMLIPIMYIGFFVAIGSAIALCVGIIAKLSANFRR